MWGYIKDISDDSKTFFDALRNIGICFVLLAGVPYLEKEVSPVWLKNPVVTFSLAVIAALYAFNIVWFISSSKRKSKFQITFFICMLTLITLCTYLVGAKYGAEILRGLLD